MASFGHTVGHVDDDLDLELDQLEQNDRISLIYPVLSIRRNYVMLL